MRRDIVVGEGQDAIKEVIELARQLLDVVIEKCTDEEVYSDGITLSTKEAIDLARELLDAVLEKLREGGG
jgi:predicted RNase H-like HicB family nuclease